MFPVVNRWMRTPLAPVGLAALAVSAFAAFEAGRLPAGPPGQRPAPPATGPILQGEWPPGDLAGAAACAGCHAGIAEEQAEHPMALTAAAPAADNTDHWFGPERLEAAVAWRSPGTPERDRTHYQRVDGGVALRGPEGDAPVAAVFGSGLRGSTPVSFPGGGRMRELRVSWSRGLGSWIETPGSEGDADPLGEVDPPEETAACLGCHATAVRWVDGTPALRDSEWGVRCERCHGPGAAHAAGAETGISRPVFNPGRLDAAAEVRFCAQCHRNPTDFAPLEVLRRDRSLARHAGASLMMSACFRESPPETGIRCLDCHDPHRRDSATRARSRTTCLRCHLDPASEHRYEPVTAVSDCVGCHMPERAEVFPGADFTDHWIRVDGLPPTPDSAATVADLRHLEVLYRNELARDPRDGRRLARLGVGLGELLLAQGIGETAFEAVERGLSGRPRYEDLLKAAALYRASGNLASGNNRRAAEILERAISEEPGAAQAFFDLGDLRLAEGDAEGAVSALAQADRLDPDSAIVLARLGDAYRAAGRLDEALAAGLRAVEADADAEQAWLALGGIRRDRRETALAAEALREAHRLAPRWPPGLAALARLLALDPDEGVRDLAEARRLAEALAGMGGYREPRSLDLLAAVHAANGDFPLAIRTAERALRRVQEEGEPALTEAISTRLDSYRQGRPWVEPVRSHP